jgi:hypothetical protein
MSFWRYVLDNRYVLDCERRQRDDIDTTRARVRALVAAQRAQATRHAEQDAELEHRVGELAVLTKAIYQYLEVAPGFDRELFHAILDGVQMELPPAPATAPAPAPRPPARRR